MVNIAGKKVTIDTNMPEWLGCRCGTSCRPIKPHKSCETDAGHRDDVTPCS